MSAIDERTIYVVDGQRFDTRDAAELHVSTKTKLAQLTDFFDNNINLRSYECAETAKVVVAHWPYIKSIMEAIE